MLPVLPGELRHFGKEWHQEAGGGKTFCLSAFLEVAFLTCHSLPSPASIQYATFYATVSKRTLAAMIGRKDSNPERAMAQLKVKVVPGSSRNQIVGWLGDALKIKVTAPPEKGKANEVVIVDGG